MTQKAYVRATKPALIVGIIAFVAFLLFGIIFFVVLMKEGAGIGMVFMAFWIFIILVIGGTYIYNLRNYDKSVESNVAEEIVIGDSTLIQATGKTGVTFDDKLRKLEGLRKEGLISEEEYSKKRTEIIEQKW
jgi:hypothetical protein